LRGLAIDPDHPDSSHWADIVPEARSRIRNFAVIGNFVCVNYLEGHSNRIEVFDVSGRRHDKLLFPEPGTVRLLRRPVQSDTLFYIYSSFTQPQTLFSYDVASSEQRLWATSHVTSDPAVEMKQVHYTSKDRTEVPMYLISRKGTGSAGPLPTFLTGYGGFGESVTPQFSVYFTV